MKRSTRKDPAATSFDSMKRELMQDPEFKKAYEAEKRREELLSKRKTVSKRKSTKVK